MVSTREPTLSSFGTAGTDQCHCPYEGAHLFRGGGLFLRDGNLPPPPLAAFSLIAPNHGRYHKQVPSFDNRTKCFNLIGQSLGVPVDRIQYFLQLYKPSIQVAPSHFTVGRASLAKHHSQARALCFS